MRSRTRSLSVILTLVAATIGSTLAHGQQSLAQFQGQMIYLSGPSNGLTDGDVAPGSGGDRFGGGGQDNAVIGEDGRAFFRAKLVSSLGATLTPTYLQFAYFYGDSRGNLVKLLRGGDAEPSGTIPNAILSTSAMGNPITGAPRIAGNGLMMFGATIWDFVGATVTATNDTVLYVGFPGSFSILAREGDPAPGCGGATYSQAFSGMSQQPTCVNSAGFVLFQSSLLGAAAVPPVVAANNAAWFGGTPGNVQLLLRKGDILPGGEQISALGFLSQMNSSGKLLTDVSFLAGSGVPAVTTVSDRALYICTPGGGIQQLVREGDPTPIPGTFFANATNSWAYGTGACTFNNNGQFLNNTSLTGAVGVNVNDRALIILSLAVHTVVFQRGDLAPGVQVANPGATLDVANDSSLCLNESGRVAFQSTLANGGVTTTNDSGIWTGTPGNLTLVAREGDVAPGTGGLLFGQTTGVQLIMNASGQLLFQNTLTGGAGLMGSTWMWDPILGLQALFRPGDQIEVQPGVFRTPYTGGGIQFTNGESRPLSFANDGTAAVKLSMTDGVSYGSQAMMRVRIGTLTGLPRTISATSGGTQNLYLNGGAVNAGQTYFVAGTASGTSPGFPAGAFNVPLNYDAYTDFTFLFPNSAILGNTFSLLSAEGRSVATINVPSGIPALAGMTLNHAYATVDGLGFITLVSEPAALSLVL